MIRKFIKKPIVIEAIQWDTNNKKAIDRFVGKELDYTGADTALIIPTLEGDMTAYCFDWIIKGIKGEFYPCKPDIFQETYEKETFGRKRIQAFFKKLGGRKIAEYVMKNFLSNYNPECNETYEFENYTLIIRKKG